MRSHRIRRGASAGSSAPRRRVRRWRHHQRPSRSPGRDAVVPGQRNGRAGRGGVRRVGLKVIVLAGRAGAASTVKAAYAGGSKGAAALAVRALARADGVEQALLAECACPTCPTCPAGPPAPPQRRRGGGPARRFPSPRRRGLPADRPASRPHHRHRDRPDHRRHPAHTTGLGTLRTTRGAVRGRVRPARLALSVRFGRSMGQS